MSVLYSSHYLLWDAAGGLGSNKLKDKPDLELSLKYEGFPRTGDLPKPEEKNRQNSMNRYVSLMKLLKKKKKDNL